MIAPLPAIDGARRDLRLCLVLVGGASLFVHLGTLVVPIYDMHLFDTVLRSQNMQTLAALSVVCLAGVALYALLAWLRACVLVVAAQRLARWLTEPVLEAGLARSLSGDPRAGAEALRDLALVRATLGGPAASTPFDLAWSPVLLAVLFMLHPAFGWLALAGAGAQLTFAVLIDRASAATLRDAQEHQQRAIHDAGVLLQDRALAVGLGMEDAAARRFSRQSAQAAAAHDRAHARAERLGAGARAVRQIFQGLLIALGALLVLRHQASPGALIGANLLFAMLLSPLDQAISGWRQWMQARIAWQRLATLLEEPAPALMPGSVPANDDLPADAAAAPGLVVDSVALQADGRTILQNISVTLLPGELLLVTGPSGAGKSTLARLMAGVLAPTQGSVALHGVAVRQLDRARLVGYLPARLQLLDATVFDTIARFADAPPERVVAAAMLAGIHTAIGRLPDGYATRIGPFSPLLSGGQKQRLALARALFGPPRLIVLDEPDASLDHEGECALRQAITDVLAGGAIVIAVSHRPTLAGIASRVLVLDAGRMVRLDSPVPMRTTG